MQQSKISIVTNTSSLTFTALPSVPNPSTTRQLVAFVISDAREIHISHAADAAVK
jgi:hypothetical protein